MTSALQHAKPQARGGVLTLISALMIGSAVIRLGLEAGPALARAPESATLHDEPQPQVPDLNALLSELSQREAALRQRENMLREKAKVIEIAEKTITQRLADLRKAEEALRETLAVADQAAERDLARLTDVYQNMKPKDAAKLFETMDPVFAAGFLARMPPDTAAGIMAGLNPQVAYTISVFLAGRNANAPTE